MKNIARFVLLAFMLGAASAAFADPVSNQPVAFSDVFRIHERP